MAARVVTRVRWEGMVLREQVLRLFQLPPLPVKEVRKLQQALDVSGDSW